MSIPQAVQVRARSGRAKDILALSLCAMIGWAGLNDRHLDSVGGSLGAITSFRGRRYRRFLLVGLDLCPSWHRRCPGRWVSNVYMYVRSVTSHRLLVPGSIAPWAIISVGSFGSRRPATVVEHLFPLFSRLSMTSPAGTFRRTWVAVGAGGHW